MSAILFVCKANRIRSPLAAALLRRHLAAQSDAGNWQVASAGVWTQAGLPAIPEAQEVAAAVGLDLRDHRSQPVDLVDLGAFDLVLAMERGQRDALRAENPAHLHRILTLTEVARGFAYDVADPIGRSIDAYRTTLRDLDSLVQQSLPRILALS